MTKERFTELNKKAQEMKNREITKEQVLEQNQKREQKKQQVQER